MLQAVHAVENIHQYSLPTQTQSRTSSLPNFLPTTPTKNLPRNDVAWQKEQIRAPRLSDNVKQHCFSTSVNVKKGKNDSLKWNRGYYCVHFRLN